MQELSLGWIRTFSLPLQLTELLKNHPRRTSSDIELIDTLLTNFEEDLHGRIENQSVKHLADLRRMDASFFANDDEAADFLHFLALQHLRTQKMEEAIVLKLPPDQRNQFRRVWKILRHIFATNITRVIYLERGHWSIVFVENTIDLTFLAGDQPIINTYAAAADAAQEVEELELYYPVLPRLAILLTQMPIRVALEPLQPEDVRRFNAFIVKAAHRQVFSESKEHLQLVLNGFYS